MCVYECVCVCVRACVCLCVCACATSSDFQLVIAIMNHCLHYQSLFTYVLHAPSPSLMNYDRGSMRSNS